MERAVIWCEVCCSQCDEVIGRVHCNSEDIRILEEATKDWTYDPVYGNLCPECQETLKDEIGKK